MDFFATLRSSTTIGAKTLIDSQKKTKTDKRKDNMRKLLIAKYQRKYDKVVPSKVIVAQINRFVDTMPLTNRNMETLEKKILEAVGQSPSKKTSKENLKAAGLASLSNFKNIQENVQPNQMAKPEQGNYMTESKVPEEKAATVDIGMTEHEEWASIMEYNQRLYKEEVRQEELQKAREKRHLMLELEKQMKEKKEREKALEEEEQQWNIYQTEYLRKQREAELKKEEERNQLLESELRLRERQIMEDAIRKKIEKEESKEQDRRTVARMKEAIEIERVAEIKRKARLQETMIKMLEDSSKLKEQQKAQALLEIEKDNERQKRQQEIAEMQEREWQENMQRKDKRDKLLMENSSKTGGAKLQREEAELENRRMKEQMKIRKERQDEEERIRIQNQIEAKEDMKRTLLRQMEERKQREEVEKEENKKQGVIWEKEAEMRKRQDEENLRKQEEFKKRHQDYLMNQMVSSRQAKGMKGMTRRSYLLNQRIVDDMKIKQDKLKASTGFK